MAKTRKRPVFTVEGCDGCVFPTLGAARIEAGEIASHAHPRVAIYRNGKLVQWICYGACGNLYTQDP